MRDTLLERLEHLGTDTLDTAGRAALYDDLSAILMGAARHLAALQNVSAQPGEELVALICAARSTQYGEAAVHALGEGEDGEESDPRVAADLDAASAGCALAASMILTPSESEAHLSRLDELLVELAELNPVAERHHRAQRERLLDGHELFIPVPCGEQGE